MIHSCEIDHLERRVEDSMEQDDDLKWLDGLARDSDCRVEHAEHGRFLTTHNLIHKHAAARPPIPLQ